MNNKVKIKDIKTGAIKEVKKSLAGDFVGTGKFIIVEEKQKEFREEKKEKPISSFSGSEK